MTGYVRPCKARLSEDDWETYQAMYCGVCRALGRRYGQAFRCLLQYDMVFYALLLARVPAELRLSRCAVHPLKTRKVAQEHPALNAAADATVLLAYGQMEDRIRDSGFWGRAASRIGLAAMKKAYAGASRRLPETARVIRENLESLAEMERAEMCSLDRPAGAFSAVLAALGEVTPEGEAPFDANGRRVRAEVLRHVGRWVYLIDAVDDYEQDLRQKLYNPIAARYTLDGPMPDEIKANMRHTLGQSRQAAAAAFDLDDQCAYPVITENILAVGLMAAEQRVFQKGGDTNGSIRSAGRGQKSKHGRSETRLSGTGDEVSPR